MVAAVGLGKDPAIKLFGRTISLPESQLSEDSESVNNGSSLMTRAETEDCKNDDNSAGTTDEAASLEQCKGEQTTEAAAASATLKPDSSSDQKQPFKRPDKILVCPRCKSSDTKFCYFNNYNVNQPRHFCKSCQRYWTAGGTVRNVPVGAGRRRNKHLASSSQFHHRQVIASNENPESANLHHHHQLLSSSEESSSTSSCTASGPNEMVLKFGPESPHYDNNQKKGNISSDNNNTICSLQPLTTSSLNDSPPTFGFVAAPPNNVALMQFVPASYLNCIPVWVAGSADLPLAVGGSPSFFSGSSGLQVLGKHPRDTHTADEDVSGLLSWAR